MRPTRSTLAVTLVWLLDWLGMASAQCDYYQHLEEHRTYHISSPNYPNYYPPGTHCRWMAVTSTGLRIRLNCDFDMPSSQACSSDHVAVSQTGSLTFHDAHNFCGHSAFVIKSLDNKMAVALVSAGSSYGGRFSCSVTAYQACDCGVRRRPRIEGGKETGVNEYPMMAALVDGDLKEIYCGATIISPDFVVTAAHCLLRRMTSMVAVLVGDHDITTGSDTDSAALILAKRFFLHPEFNSRTQVNDIALVRLSRAATFSSRVGPVCLPFRFVRHSFAGLNVIVLGWGRTEFAGPLSDRLKQTELRVVDDAGCRSAHPAEVITDNQICTFAVDTDACQSDSGGPLLWQDPNTGRLHLLGVVSYGIGCASDSPGVNTRVDAYLDWIQKITQASFCTK